VSTIHDAIRAVLDAPRSPDAPIPVDPLDRLHTLVLGAPARDRAVLERLDDIVTVAYGMGREDERETLVALRRAAGGR
jgi:hypothetical protein